MITIIDCGTGNFRSIENAFKCLRQKVKVTDKFLEIKKAKKIVLIGVGNFGEVIKNLKRKKLDLLIKKEILAGKPFLGICLGMQLLFKRSQESPGKKGLGVFRGKCLKFKEVKTPQLGWNKIKIKRNSPILRGIQKDSFFYFMHSFYVEPVLESLVVATTNYERDFCSVVNFKNIYGVQFHPEKSGKAGLQILKNFVEL